MELTEKHAPKLGSGDRFRSLSNKLSHKSGVRNPGALAASIGRKKYGKGKFQKMAAAGRRRHESAPGELVRRILAEDVGFAEIDIPEIEADVRPHSEEVREIEIGREILYLLAELGCKGTPEDSGAAPEIAPEGKADDTDPCSKIAELAQELIELHTDKGAGGGPENLDGALEDNVTFESKMQCPKCGKTPKKCACKPHRR
jgi:hypothetical protein